MNPSTPAAELDSRFSAESASPSSWQETTEVLDDAEVYWVTTVRTDGRPHVTPTIAVWHHDALWFCTGPTEQKARNLDVNRHCVLTTGCNSLQDGLDVVLEGDARREQDERVLREVADLYEQKYGADWHFDVADGDFHGDGGPAHVFAVAPTKALAFRKGDYAQTRWRFGAS